MKYRLIILAYLSSILLMAAIAIFIVTRTSRIISAEERGEEHFQTLAAAATEASSYAKRAEGHLLLYLLLGSPEDRDKVPLRIASLQEQVGILDRNMKNPQAREILDKIKILNGELDRACTEILAIYAAKQSAGGFQPGSCREKILDLNDRCSAIREHGVELTKFEVNLENDIRLEISRKIYRLRAYLLVLFGLVLAFTIYIGFVLTSIIDALRKEIAHRVRSEQAVVGGKNKLAAALAQIKVLGGLLPICSACKKVRDDAGYWNQIESYLRANSGLEFTHSICPECEKKICEEMDEDVRDLQDDAGNDQILKKQNDIIQKMPRPRAQAPGGNSTSQ